MIPHGRALVLAFVCAALPCPAQSTGAGLAPETQAAIEAIVTKTLAETGAPSASVAVVKDKVVFAKAFRDARVKPKTPATAEMRYKIASNSKQIAATAILLLAEQRKVSLDDTVAKYLPDLTRAREITIRQLLSHTSGYQDYYPLDYIAPFMARDTSAQQILAHWGKQALDFDPGTKWQYSNTNYVIVGQIIEKVTGKPLMDFLRASIFEPLGMRSVMDVTRDHWSDADPVGYAQFALAPAHEAPPEGNGWMYAAGELAMTARDLSTWDQSLIEGKLLKPESIRSLTTEVLLKGGTGTHYALGLEVGTAANGNRRWSHSGGASGFVSRNTMFPDDHLSITVLTNAEGPAADVVAKKIEELLFAPAADPQAGSALENAKKLFTSLQNGEVNTALITSDLAYYFSPEAVASFSASLKPLGTPESFTAGPHEGRGGMTFRGFAVKAGGKSMRISSYLTPEGKFAQFLVTLSN